MPPRHHLLLLLLLHWPPAVMAAGLGRPLPAHGAMYRGEVWSGLGQGAS